MLYHKSVFFLLFRITTPLAEKKTHNIQKQTVSGDVLFYPK